MCFLARKEATLAFKKKLKRAGKRATVYKRVLPNKVRSSPVFLWTGISYTPQGKTVMAGGTLYNVLDPVYGGQDISMLGGIYAYTSLAEARRITGSLMGLNVIVALEVNADDLLGVDVFGKLCCFSKAKVGREFPVKRDRKSVCAS